MKKIIVVLLFIMLYGSVAFAAEPVTVTASTVSITPSEKAVITVSVSENSALCGGGLNLIYDNSLLKAEDYEISALIGNYSCMVNTAYAENVIRISWAGTETLTNGGDLFSVTFSPLSDSAFETKITIDKLKLADVNSEKIDALSVDGKVIMKTAVDDNADDESSGSSRRYSKKTAENNEKTEEATLPFSDVSADNWFYDSVKYVFEKELMNGVSENEFAPQNIVTRAMLITVLYRLEKEPPTNKSIPYADVDMNAYYANAVSWAKQNGIVNGISENEFAPEKNITREQIAAIMYRYAQYKGYDVSIGKSTDILYYDDAGSVSEYASDAVRYSVGSGLIKGKTKTTLNPQDYASRAEIATVLQRFIEMNK